MNKHQSPEKYEFPEFARGTLIEHLEKGRSHHPRRKEKNKPNFWNTLANFLSEKNINFNL